MHKNENNDSFKETFDYSATDLLSLVSCEGTLFLFYGYGQLPMAYLEQSDQQCEIELYLYT